MLFSSHGESQWHGRERRAWAPMLVARGWASLMSEWADTGATACSPPAGARAPLPEPEGYCSWRAAMPPPTAAAPVRTAPRSAQPPLLDFW